MAAAFEIRPLRSNAELRECVALQEEVWGAGFSERVPTAILKVGARLGGVTAGAFDEGGRMAGFVFGLTGIEEGTPVHWSDMLAVREEARGRGLGRRLKAHQREVLLGRGVRRCYWTFDPLEARNGWLNLGRLGAVATEYLPDMYGETDSPLHRAVGTDRLLAVWEMGSARVESRVEGSAGPPGPAEVETESVAFEVDRSGPLPRPLGPSRPPPRGDYLVPLPPDLQEMLRADPELARSWRESTRDALAPRLDEGYEVRELVRGGRHGPAYLVVAP